MQVFSIIYRRGMTLNGCHATKQHWNRLLYAPRNQIRDGEAEKTLEAKRYDSPPATKVI